MRVSLLIACGVLCVPTIFLAQEKQASDKKPADKKTVEKAAAPAEEQEPPARVDLLRFRDKNLHEHVYTYGEIEPQHWREREEMHSETVIGKVALTKEKGTTQLYRAIRKDGRHYFWLIKPTKLKDFELEDFHAYVWTKGGDGRIPIHACVMPDAHDLLLDPDMKVIDKWVEETRNGIGVRRRVFSKMFYVYPPDKEEEPAEEK